MAFPSPDFGLTKMTPLSVAGTGRHRRVTIPWTSHRSAKFANADAPAMPITTTTIATASAPAATKLAIAPATKITAAAAAHHLSLWSVAATHNVEIPRRPQTRAAST